MIKRTPDLQKQQDLQVEILNKEIKATLAPSKIHGIGVFAIRDIKKHEKVYCDNTSIIFELTYENLDRLRSEVKKIILERWPSIINGSKFISPDARLVSFMNHQDAGECNYSQVTDTAKRDIKCGEEITEDYRLMQNYVKIYPFLKK